MRCRRFPIPSPRARAPALHPLFRARSHGLGRLTHLTHTCTETEDGGIMFCFGDGPPAVAASAEAAPAKGHGTGRDDNDGLAPGPESGDVAGHGLQPGGVDIAMGGIDEE